MKHKYIFILFSLFFFIFPNLFAQNSDSQVVTKLNSPKIQIADSIKVKIEKLAKNINKLTKEKTSLVKALQKSSSKLEYLMNTISLVNFVDPPTAENALRKERKLQTLGRRKADLEFKITNLQLTIQTIEEKTETLSQELAFLKAPQPLFGQ